MLYPLLRTAVSSFTSNNTGVLHFTLRYTFVFHWSTRSVYVPVHTYQPPPHPHCVDTNKLGEYNSKLTLREYGTITLTGTTLTCSVACLCVSKETSFKKQTKFKISKKKIVISSNLRAEKVKISRLKVNLWVG